MAIVKCVHGAPCSGKTTYVRNNAGKNDIVWDYDSIRKALTLGEDHSQGSEAQNQMVNKLRYTFAKAAFDSEADTAWFICTYPNDFVKELLGDGAEYIQMDATREECLERLENDDTRPDKDFMRELINGYYDGNPGIDRRSQMNPDREYRSMEMRIFQPEETEEKSYMVEGYASTFEPYTLFTRDGVDYKERIEPTAFDEADLTDVVFRVDHEGRVYARSSAGTVEIWHDEHGLGQRTDLSKTQAARELFADIEAGNYPKMSFAFTVAENGDSFDRETHTRTISRIAKVFDVSPVSFPANPGTQLSVSTRAYFDGVIEMEQAERLEEERREKQKQLIKLLTEV